MILTWGSNNYVKYMIYNFKNTLGFDPSKKHSAIPPNYKPEVYITDLCNDTEKAQ